jgi:hypothetical protein
MPVDHIRYDLLTQEALRDVIKTVLTDAAVKGLPGDHHFFVTFDTRAEGVRMSPRLRAIYPEDMTIVLQHQFWDLAVSDSDFEVGLAFNGIPERLHIPLKAVKAFFDPSVQFGLQFAVETENRAANGDEKAETPPHTALEQKLAAPRKKSKQDRKQETKPASGAEPVSPASDSAKTLADPTPAAAEDTPARPATGGEVVRLDRFRKK